MPFDSSAVEPGTLVLAKCGAHPYWPARVGVCLVPGVAGFNTWRRGDERWVDFVGDNQGAWILVGRIKAFTPGKARRHLVKDPRTRANQLKAIDQALTEHTGANSGKRLTPTQCPPTHAQLFGHGAPYVDGDSEALAAEAEHPIDVQLGDLVLAKCGDFPFWPARVGRCLVPGEYGFNTWKQEDEVWVDFIGDDDLGAWINVKLIRSFTPDEAKRYLTQDLRDRADQQKAIDLATQQYRRADQGPKADTDRRPNAHAVASTQASTTEAEDLQPIAAGLGDLVLAKCALYPFWPAVVGVCKVPGEKGVDTWRQGDERWVNFVGSDDGAWVNVKMIKRFTPDEARRHLTTNRYDRDEQQKAIDIAVDAFRAKQDASVSRSAPPAARPLTHAEAFGNISSTS